MNKLITRHKLYFFATIIALIALMTFQGAALAEPGKAKAIDACMTRKMAYTIKASGATPRSEGQTLAERFVLKSTEQNVSNMKLAKLRTGHSLL